ncbi:MAG: glycosyltransferase family 39 protein [Magnetococcales bacterium]|nr:glycosyltransferase family 39 protein [Magnetococcales bacterium]
MTATSPERLSIRGWWLVLVLAILWFSFLGYRDLIEPDEGRYAEIPREMVASGDWLTPRLNTFLYFEKPPLQYWATAVFYHWLGVDNASSRLWTALTGFVGILLTLAIGRRIFGDTAGWTAALVLSSMLLYTALGHFNTLDMSTGMWMFLGVGALVLGQHDRHHPTRNRNAMLVAWAALAGATLSKGLIGLVLPGASVVLYSLWQRDWALWRHMHLVKGLVLFVCLTAPWFIMVSRVNPDFASFFFIHEHFDRFATPSHSRPGPWWYFIGVLLVGTLPWTAKVLKVILRPGFSWRPGTGEFDPARLLWVYAMFVLFFFSVSHSKLIPYIIPMFPPLALLVGRLLAQMELPLPSSSWDWEIRALLLLAMTALIACTIPDLLASHAHPPDMIRMLRPWLLTAAVVFLLTLLIAWRQPGRHSLWLMSLLILTGFQILTLGAQELSPTKSSREAAHAILTAVPPDTPVYAVDSYFQSLPFYLQRPLRLVNFQGELEFGIQRQPERWIGHSDLFRRQWMASDQAVAVFNRDDLPNWQKESLPMRVIHQDGKRVVVVRR